MEQQLLLSSPLASARCMEYADAERFRHPGPLTVAPAQRLGLLEESAQPARRSSGVDTAVRTEYFVCMYAWVCVGGCVCV